MNWDRIQVRFCRQKKMFESLSGYLRCETTLTMTSTNLGDLKMRFGLHSGPVTAGVLRGEKSRFQLFGDTVNTGMLMRP